MKKSVLLFMAVFFVGTGCGKKDNGDSGDGQYPGDLPPSGHKLLKTKVKKVEPTKILVKKPVIPKKTKIDKNIMSLDQVKKGVAAYKTVLLGYPSDNLKERDKPFIKKLIEASKIIDEIFFKQAYGRNKKIRNEIVAAVKKKSENQPYLDLFNINYGPWDRAQGNKIFWGKRKKPVGAGFYDSRLSRSTFNRYLNYMEGVLEELGKRPKKKSDRALKLKVTEELNRLKSPYTTVHRKNGKFLTTPYSEVYNSELVKVSNLLKEAAKLTNESSLKKYLNLRAKAFLYDDYVLSEFSWLRIRGSVGITIGPNHSYEDRLGGYKTSFEASVTIVDKASLEKLKELSIYKNRLDRNLPYPERFMRKGGKKIAINVVNELYSAGKPGATPVAYLLPGDPEVRNHKRGGYKLIILKNVVEAKFNSIVVPISKVVINPTQHKYVTFNGFFNQLLHHEFSHGLGPLMIKDGKTKVRISEKLQEFGHTMEEAKADMAGLLGIVLMVKKKKLPPLAIKEGYVTFISSIFRVLRLGTHGARWKSNLMALNYLLNEKAISHDLSTTTYTINFERMTGATRKLAKEILLIQTSGNYAGAAQFVKRWSTMPLSGKHAIEKLKPLPIDIKVKYKITKE
jgi:Peptidase family M49